jgi:hypothetical protein
MWVYSIVCLTGISLILIPLAMKFAYESPSFVLAVTGNLDECKHIINCIAEINDEEQINDKIAFSYSPQQIRKRRSLLFQLKNLFNNRVKLFILSVICL